MTISAARFLPPVITDFAADPNENPPSPGANWCGLATVFVIGRDVVRGTVYQHYQAGNFKRTAAKNQGVTVVDFDGHRLSSLQHSMASQSSAGALLQPVLWWLMG